jgi:hypothetical protein
MKEGMEVNPPESVPLIIKATCPSLLLSDIKIKLTCHGEETPNEIPNKNSEVTQKSKMEFRFF